MKFDLPEHITSILERIGDTDLSDHEIYDTFKSAFRACSNAKERSEVQDVFNGLSYFYVDSPHPLLASMAKRAVRNMEGTHFKKTLLKNHHGNLDGVELCNDSRTQFVIFSDDASEPGRVRYSCFDERGFFGHTTRDSYEEVLSEAWRDGFRSESKGMLATLAASESFIKGIEHTHKIARVNSGESWESVFPVSQSTDPLASQHTSDTTVTFQGK